MGAGFNRNVNSSQLESLMRTFKISQSAGTYTIDDGVGDFTLTKNGTGDVTLTFVTPYAKLMCASNPVPVVANLRCQLSEQDASHVRYVFTNNSGTATETGFQGFVLGSMTDTVKR